MMTNQPITTTNPFKKAERKRAWLKLGISGPSGSGKTWSALKLVKGMSEAENKKYKIAVIDTENRSASLYADSEGMPEFDVLELTPPFTVEKYQKAIDLAVQNQYDVLIIDSISHVWSGEGGLLQEKESLDARGGNSYTNWAKMTPKWNKFVSSILHSNIHLICNMRSKQDYVLETNDKGKQAPKKVGMAPVVREGFEYELSTVFELDMAHQAQASKDRTGLFDDRIFKISEQTGKEFITWLSGGKTTSQASSAVTANVQVEPIKQMLEAAINARNTAGWTKEKVKFAMTSAFGTDDLKKLNNDQALNLENWIKTKTANEFLGQFVKSPDESTFDNFQG